MEEFDLSQKSHLYYALLSLESFKDYVKFVENNLSSHHKIIHDEYISTFYQLQDFGNDVHLNDRFSELSHALNEVELEFIQRFRYSVIIQAYSFLETELNKWCESLFFHLNSEFQVNDLRGQNDLYKVKRYLQNTINCNLSKSIHWQYICDLKRLRNNIVHYHGIISHTSGDFQAISQFARNGFTLRASVDCSYIRISDCNFLITSLEKISEFLVETINFPVNQFKANL